MSTIPLPNEECDGGDNSGSSGDGGKDWQPKATQQWLHDGVVIVVVGVGVGVGWACIDKKMRNSNIMLPSTCSSGCQLWKRQQRAASVDDTTRPSNHLSTFQNDNVPKSTTNCSCRWYTGACLSNYLLLVLVLLLLLLFFIIGNFDYYSSSLDCSTHYARITAF